jgi:hypothetical protein
MGQEMKCLTLWQPYAQLILERKKKIETRSWKTAYRGELAIHASARRLDSDVARAFGYDVIKTLFPLGVVLCVVELTDCHVMTPAFIREIKTTQPDEYLAGIYAPDRYAWHLRLIRVLPESIPARGRQMLWEWTPP